MPSLTPRRTLALSGLALLGALAWRYREAKRRAIRSLRAESQVARRSPGR